MSKLHYRLKSLGIMLAGCTIIGLAFCSSPELQNWLLIGLGIVACFVGGWQLYGRNFVKERRNKVLRDEVESFIELVRQVHSLFQTSLHGRPYPWHDAALSTLTATMHESVERMIEVAETGELAEAVDQTKTAAA